MAQLDNSSYHTLVEQIGNLLKEGRNKAYYAVNTILVETYWNIGKYIFEYELKGNQRAECGEELGKRLSRDLTRAYGKGFSHSNIVYMRKALPCFPKKSDTV